MSSAVQSDSCRVVIKIQKDTIQDGTGDDTLLSQ